MSSTADWTDREREVLRVVGDLLVPAADGMPAASHVDVHGVGIDEVGAIRPDLVMATRTYLHGVGGDVPSSVAELREAAGPYFTAVSELLASAYFLRPEVAKLIGYRQRVAIPLDAEESRSALFTELASPVLARGNVWRSTPNAQGGSAERVRQDVDR